ncbi:MAG: bifunctional pyr operon transcriptional regulator/uracil phosphoribosyltransferase PyrR [Bacteroidetes bacterium]|nr:bifunctional pyr operon transcriptional regulator/uracil phosphoribosyltransferase PyrR [Bacteroidota bacterium]
MNRRILLNSKQIEVISQRLCCQLMEQHGNFSKSAIIGLQPRGILFAKRVHRIVSEMTRSSHIKYGDLDTTFYRDDFRRGNEIPEPKALNMDFNVEGLRVILIDDVLYTGRSVRAALDALNDFGRPAQVELMTLIDRRYNRELPIQPDYVGLEVDTRSNEKVKVEWNDEEGNKIWILENNS